MLEIVIPATEMFDESTQEFIMTTEQKLRLEHSLVSLSKWESKWCKPYLTKTEKTMEETIDYIKCMTITQNVDPDVYLRITNEQLRQIYKYIEAPMTATTFSKFGNQSKPGRGEQITAELVYYWMVSLNIPFECQKWHLNKLLTLIRVCEIKNTPPKKMSRKQTASNYAALNKQRRQQMKTKG